MTLRYGQIKNDKSLHVITFNLQQALPTPKLTTGPAFYKRKCWTYNFNIHNCADGTGYFSWSEDTAGHGNDDICSCLIKESF